MNIDKIPIETMVYSPGNESYHIGTLEISKGEYANSEKSNEIIEWVRDLQERVFKLEQK